MCWKERRKFIFALIIAYEKNRKKDLRLTLIFNNEITILWHLILFLDSLIKNSLILIKLG